MLFTPEVFIRFKLLFDVSIMYYEHTLGSVTLGYVHVH